MCYLKLVFFLPNLGVLKKDAVDRPKLVLVVVVKAFLKPAFRGKDL